MGLSNLPDGVTQRMIDAAFSGPCEFCAEGEHSQCDDRECVCQVCDEIAEDDAADRKYQERKERDLFDDRDEPDFD